MQPIGGLTLDAKGNLYGTTQDGGDMSCGIFGCGTVFELDTSGKKTVLHTFTGSPDGAVPFGGALVFDAKGNLYGTTSGGGAHGGGTVFKLAPDKKLTVLYSFTGGADGALPYTGRLLLDAKGNLYGTTWKGGAYGRGVVFRVSNKGKETVLHSFTGKADGAQPIFDSLISDANGNLYGTTNEGGEPASGCNNYGCGTVFKLTSDGKTFTVLYTFKGGEDGSWPQAGLTWDAEGNLYGETMNGGGSFDGVVYEVSSKGKETVLHRFTGGADGASPPFGLISDAKGNLYGATLSGGNSNYCSNGPGCGVVFKVTPE